MESHVITQSKPIRKPLRWKRLLQTLALLLIVCWIGHYFLVRQMVLPRRVISFPNEVVSLDLSPDGRTVAVGTNTDIQLRRQLVFTGEVSLWDTQTGELRRRLQTGLGVSTVAFSPDGRILASVSGRTYQRAFRLWDVQTGRLLRTLATENEGEASIAFSPDGRSVAVGEPAVSLGNEPTGKIKVWDTGTGALRRTFLAKGGVHSIVFSPDGRLLAGASWLPGNDLAPIQSVPARGIIYIFDSQTGQRLHVLSIKSIEASLAFSPDGRWLATAGQVSGWTPVWGLQPKAADHSWLSDEFNLFDVKTGVRRWTQWSNQGAELVVFSPNSHWIAGGGLKVELRDARTGNLLRTLNPPWQSFANWTTASCLAISHDGTTLASRSSKTVNLWDIRGVP